MANLVRADAPTSRFTDDILTIKAGTGRNIKSFVIHEGIIKGQSEFFRAAFDRKWAEGQFRELELPEEDPSIVAAYIEWVYSGKIPTPSFAHTTQKKHQAIYQDLVKLYIFGEKFQDDECCNDTMSVILEKCDEKDETISHRYPIRETVMMLYEGTPVGSPARKLAVHLHVAHGNSEWLNADVGIQHPEFILDLAKALMDSRPQPKKIGGLHEQRTTWFKSKEVKNEKAGETTGKERGEEGDEQKTDQ